MKRVVVRNSNLKIHLEGEWIKFTPFFYEKEDIHEGKKISKLYGSAFIEDKKVIEAIKKTQYFIEIQEMEIEKETKEDTKEIKKK